MPLSCSKLEKINPAEYYTGYDGSQKWKKIHDTVNSIECEFCRDKGIKLMRGIHDAVNIHIGKKRTIPKRFEIYSKIFSESGSKCPLILSWN